MKRIAALALTGIVALWAGNSVRADIIAQANFQTGTVENWGQPFDANAVTVVTNAGPAGVGDFAIRSIPEPGVLFMFPQNTSTPGFVGNYIASGAAQVQFDYRGEGTLPADVELYVVMTSGGSNRWVSLGNVVPTTNWQSATISIQQADLVHPLGGNVYATDFANISRFGFRFQSAALQAGGSSVGSANYELFLDNVQLQSIPEPGGLAAALAIALGAVARRRRAA